MLPEIHHEMNLFLMNKNRKWGLERLLSGDKELLCHHEDLSSNPQHRRKKLDRVALPACNPSIEKEGADGENSLASLPRQKCELLVQ